ncbi:hypothetical protein CFP56_027311 [Quercus suber]|uniref:Uncharacterized protein n=1 Tax=Quercus suber TaxID=58331 RepID=A0AAW0LWS6_QUESU|nr:hypothetical protein CFP56_38292 [Quercus suber]
MSSGYNILTRGTPKSANSSSYLQSFEQNPTHTKNIILKGKGFPSLLLSQPQAIFKVLNRTPSIPETLSS